MASEPIDESWGHWFAGFVDGEGCFEVRRTHHPRCLRPSYTVRFRLTLRLDDRAVLDDACARLGVGNVATVRDRYVAFNVLSKEGHARLVELFDRFPLRAKKREDYLLWREAVQIQSASRRGMWGPAADERAEKLGELCDRLRAGRVFEMEEVA